MIYTKLAKSVHFEQLLFNSYGSAELQELSNYNVNFTHVNTQSHVCNKFVCCLDFCFQYFAKHGHSWDLCIM